MEEKEFIDLNSLILNGKDHLETIETDIGKFQVRPLSLGEKALIQSLAVQGMQSTAKTSGITGDTMKEKETEVNINVQEVQEAEWKVKFQTLAFGLSCNGKKYTVDQIKSLSITQTVLNQIYGGITKLSDISFQTLSKFREGT